MSTCSGVYFYIFIRIEKNNIYVHMYCQYFKNENYYIVTIRYKYKYVGNFFFFFNK